MTGDQSAAKLWKLHHAQRTELDTSGTACQSLHCPSDNAYSPHEVTHSSGTHATLHGQQPTVTIA